MAYYSSSSSDSDEDEDSSSIPSSVTNYHFVTSSSSDNEVPISFSSLPAETPVYLHGTTSDGLQTVYEQVLDWKLDLRLRTEPGVYVKTKTEKWVRLGKPRKFFEKVVRGVLIACQVLHFVKWNLSAGTERGLWDHLRRVFDKFERRPCEDDLVPHFGFMKQFAEQDEALRESQLLKELLERKGRRRTGEGNSSAEVKESFIVADDEELFLDTKNGNDSDEEDEKDLFDSCCCICDNGGDLLCCEGECMRSFHATKVAGEESACRSLGFTEAQVDAIQNFLCRNCQVKQHQCFVCGKLGNSDKSKGAEVFQCSNATCGYFYHPPCVAKLLHPDDESKQTECETDVKNGKFVCPAHRCFICKKLEVKKDYDMNFAVCRRCPKSYHRKCLPRKIAVEADAEERGIMTRAWDNLLPNRLLIYCLKHKIEEGLGTPLRNHVIFPDENREKNKEKEFEKNKESEENKHVLEKRKRQLESEESPSERGPIKKRELETEQKELKRKKPVLINPNEQQNKRIVRKEPQIEVNKAEGSKRQVAASDSPKFSSTRKIVKNSFPVITEDTKKKIRELYERESAKVTMEDILKKRTIPLTHQNTGRQIEKVPRGKIEGSVEAIQAAYQRISEGKSVDDAKALCEPEVVKQVAKWNKRLGVYLSPFLHGMRYTSFGRHFTKEEKLQEIVNKLHWYVQPDDTVVDFCCGSNDFSRLMKQKMDTMGKTCTFKNFDIMYPQNDFCFEKRDWMTVEPKELPTGSSLIMGLNPPFGSKAALANRFIDKALTFKPKLLILIVPKETERLDKKRLGSTRYELVWEDNISLSGKSFYLPGSIDENDNQMDQWNVSAPVLYLWSRSDWATRHKDLAEEHAHFSVFSSDLYEQNDILGEGKSILREDEREAGDIISQVVGDINVEVEEGDIEECNEVNEEGNMEILKGKEKVESDGEMKEREERRERKRKKKEERGNRKRKLIEERERESEGKEEREREGGLDETEWRLNLERERESEAERERERANEEVQKRAREEKEREIEEAKKRAEEREREKEAEKIADERERAKEAKKKLAEEEEAIRRAEEKEREKEAKRRAEQKEREKEAKKKAEQKEREIEAKQKAEEERESKRRHEEEKEREAKRRAEEEEEAKRIIAEEESEKELAAKMRAEEKAEEKKRLTQEREREIEARRKRIAEAKRIAEEKEREIKAKRIAEEREKQKEAKRIAEDREREIKAKQEREREAQRKISLERERERERRESTERERETTPYFNRRRSSPTISRERNNINPNSTSRERNNTPFDPIIDMEISPKRNNNIITKHTSQNHPIETRHLDSINTTNNLPIQSEPIESRHLATQDEFAGLDSLFNNNINEDIDEIAKRYSSGPSYNWSSIGTGFRSDYLIDNNNNRGFDDYNNQFNNNNPYALGLMSPVRSIHGNNSSASYLSGFGGTGTSGSVSDRYAPRLDETNYLNRPPGFQGQFGNYGYGGLSGYDNTGAVRREIPQPQSDRLGFQSDQLGFQTRNQYRPPPGSSGGWIND